MSGPFRVACVYAAASCARQSCSTARARVRHTVDSDGAPGTPSSSHTRRVSALLVGSTTRARTRLRNVSLPTVSNPSRAYAASRTSHSTRDPTTVGPVDRGGDAASSTPGRVAPARSAGRDRDQRGELRDVVGRAEVLQDGLLSATRARDLHRGRARPGAQLPHEQAQRSSLDSHR